MRVAIYFDGKNFFEALKSYDPTLGIDFERFAAWVTEAVGGPQATFVGAYYYTGFSSDPAIGPLEKGARLAEFLDYLSFARGFFVRREPRVLRSTVCKNCKTTYEYTEEKRVDTRMVADLIHYAAVNAFDVAVLASGDDDFVPAVEAVAELGKQVYIGVWPGQGVSRELRAGAFGKIDFSSGVQRFARYRAAPGVTVEAIPSVAQSAPADPSAAILEALREAEGQLTYVSRWYFVNRWRMLAAIDPDERERIIDHLVGEGRIEEYLMTDSKGRLTAALRLPATEAEASEPVAAADDVQT